MITINRVVYELTDAKHRKFFERFEAIEFAKTPADIMEIWRRNKTPVIVHNQFSTKVLSGYTLVEVPKTLIGNIEGFIEFSHANGVECGEFDTGIKYDLSNAHCFLCDIARYNEHQSAEMHNMHAKPVDMIIYESPHFYVISELGALKLGYLMICSKDHYLSVAQFPLELMPEYKEVCRDVEAMLLKAFKGSKVVCFMEHGSGPGKAAHASAIEHQHTHVVVDFTLKQEDMDRVQMHHCDDISSAKEVYYFAYHLGADGELWISDDPGVYRNRQLPRQYMARERGLAPDKYNWRHNPCLEMVFESLEYLYKMLKDEHEGSRLYDRTKAFVTAFGKRFRK